MVKCGNNFSALLQSGCAKICFVVRQTALYPSQMSRKLPLRYCQKAIPEETTYEYELIYMHGTLISRKKQKYCSKRCASHDQMAHEL